MRRLGVFEFECVSLRSLKHTQKCNKPSKSKTLSVMAILSVYEEDQQNQQPSSSKKEIILAEKEAEAKKSEEEEKQQKENKPVSNKDNGLDIENYSWDQSL